jgi:hypothetical protein
MTLYDRIREDHASARDRLQAIRTAGNRDRRAALFERLKRDLLTHHMVEDAVVYSALAHTDEMPEAILEAGHAHRRINGLLEELDGTPIDSDQWHARLSDLEAAMRENFREEETAVFGALRDRLSDAEVEELGRKLTTRMEVAREVFEPVEDMGEEEPRPTALELGPC